MSEFSSKIINGRERLILSLMLEEEGEPPQDPAAELGARIGPYHLVERLGEGRVGVVWRARQDQPFQRDVVIRILKAGMDSRQDLALFNLERQALSAMDHPNIVALLDVGVTTDGRAYIVLEHAAGQPLCELVQNSSVPWQEKLGVFMQACSAISHAHGRGVIHLDLQPANIVVSNTEGRPAPKILNFGVARTLPRQWWGDFTLSVPLRPRVTSRFTAPELLAGQPRADLRSDVYSMGVLLHELLTGTKLACPGEAETAAPAAYQRLPGGLWEVVRKATALNPDDRQDSIDSLAADLKAHAEASTTSDADASS